MEDVDHHLEKLNEVAENIGYSIFRAREDSSTSGNTNVLIIASLLTVAGVYFVKKMIDR